jgi:hypothetical protein
MCTNSFTSDPSIEESDCSNFVASYKSTSLHPANAGAFSQEPGGGSSKEKLGNSYNKLFPFSDNFFAVSHWLKTALYSQCDEEGKVKDASTC